MKALSLTQPWATLVAIGQKSIETRSWSTAYRGVLAIHAAKGFPRYCLELCTEEPFRDVLRSHRLLIREMPLGAIVAVARLTAVERTESIRLFGYAGIPMLPHEMEFGDYSDHRFGWVLADVRRLPVPVPCKGALGLWDVPAEIYEAIAPQLHLVKAAP